MTTGNVIKFYRTNEEYGFLSNFAPFRIFVDGTIWLTTEHYFQASKFPEHEIKMKIKAIESPMEAATEGRKTRNPIRGDWDSVKDDIMRKALRAKFLQHQEIRMKLIGTGESQLIEHTSNDSYWADGGDGLGKNMLGILLMELRAQLKNISPDANWPLPPWIVFPEIDPEDMFWRMGLGDDFIYKWVKWINSQDAAIQLNYRNHFPLTEGWEGFYD